MNTKYLQFLIFMSLIVGLLATTYATEIEVEAGQNKIGAAYASAEAGDVIVLTTSGGEYIETAAIEVTKDITFRAADGLAQKPVIYAAANYTFYITTGGLTVDGIIFNGTFHNNPITAYPFSIKASETVTSNDFSLKINNCEIRNFIKGNGKGIYSSDASKTALDSIIITNTIFDNIAKYAAYLKTTKGNVYPGSFKYLKWENCFISNIFGDDGMVCYIEPADRDSTEVAEVVMNHITAMGLKSRGIYINGIGGAVIRNSIVVDVGEGNQDSSLARYAFYADKGNDPASELTTIENCLYWESLFGASASNMVNIINADPMFADTANSDYTLLDSSPGKNAGTDGLDLGYIPGGLPTAINEIDSQIPEQFNLSQNYPNPFNPSTTIQFSIPESGFYSIRVFNILGQEVAELINKEVATGNYSVEFDASKLTSGLYIYSLTGNNISITRKMMLLK